MSDIDEQSVSVAEQAMSVAEQSVSIAEQSVQFRPTVSAERSASVAAGGSASARRVVSAAMATRINVGSRERQRNVRRGADSVISRRY